MCPALDRSNLHKKKNILTEGGVSTLRWASPIRRDGLRELSSIPNEIYLEILGYLRPSNAGSGAFKHDLRNIARVCRFFCSVALPWIYESFHLEIGIDDTDTRPENRTKFCRRLLNGEEAAQLVAHFVKKCHISWFPGATGMGWAEEELLSMYSKAISHMPNIEEIILWRIHIKKDVLKSLASLQQLNTLRILDCHIAHDMKEKYLEKISTLRLSSLGLLIPPFINGQPSQTLVSIMERINFNRMTRLLTTMIPPVVLEVWESSESLALVELDVCHIDMASLFRLLARTPSLKILRIAESFHSDQIPPEAPAAPMLEELKAPLSVCKALVPGRPIANLMVSRTYIGHPAYVETQNILGLAEASIFQSASRPIVQLKVAVQFYLEVPFWRHFPSLRVLHLDIFTCNQSANPQTTMMIKDPIQQIISKFTDAWPRHPALHTLTFEGGCADKELFNLEQQHSWIKDSLVPKIPTLRTCCFSEYIEWHYDEPKALWKPMVPDSRLRRLRYLLQKVGEGYPVDFDNCLEGVLHATSL